VTVQIMLAMLDHGHSWWRMLGAQLGSWAVWIPVAPWIVRMGADLRWGEERSRPLLVRAAGLCMVITLVQLLVSAGCATLFRPFHPVGSPSFLRNLESRIVSWSVVDILVFLSLVAVGSAVAANQRSRSHELRESRLEAELARAQLDALRLEIQPHFLFNTLNSVAALVRRRSNQRALEVVLGLSELLRSTLDRSDRQLVPLHEELDFVRRYVALQRTRFEDRLRVSFEIDDSLLDEPVPWLVLQPLVETAIRHGVAPRANGGSVVIRARRTPEGLALEVEDDGPGPASASGDENRGIGLDNTRSRLHQLYHDAASLSLGRVDDHTLAVARIPTPSALPEASVG
jgi:hypothetical protein